MKDPVSRLRKKTELEDRWDRTTFSSILEMKLRFEIRRKLLRSSVDRDGLVNKWIEILEKAGQELVWIDRKIPPERERLTGFVGIGPTSLKQSFKNKIGMESREHCLLSETEVSLLISVTGAGYKTDQLRRRNRWKKKRIRRIRWQKKNWCGCLQVCLRRSLCRQERMHLETLEESLKNFDEELCWWGFRVCEDWHMIQLQDWKNSALEIQLQDWKNSALDLTWVAFCSEFREVKGRLPASPTLLKSKFRIWLEHGCKLM